MRKDDRGVILPQFVSTDQDEITSNLAVSASLLRHALFYFDKIDMPQSLIRRAPTADDEFLMSCGVLQRSQIENSGGTISQIVSQTLEQTFINNENIHPGQWMIGQEKLNETSTGNVQGRALIVEFVNAIPFPKKEAPLLDILEFKEKRRDNLLQLRRHLEELYASTEVQLDKSLRIKTACDRVHQDLQDISRLMNEKSLLQTTRNLSMKIDISSLWKQALVGGTSFEYMCEMPGLGAILGMLSSTIKFDCSISLRPRIIPENLRPYAYVFDVNSSLG